MVQRNHYFYISFEGGYVIFKVVSERKTRFFGIFLVALTFKLHNRYANRRRLKPAATKNRGVSPDTKWQTKCRTPNFRRICSYGSNKNQNVF